MDDNDKLELGRRVKVARVRRGLQQGELAAAAGLRSPSYISMLERGKRTPSMSVLHRLAEVLKVSTEYLLHGSDPLHTSKEPTAQMVYERPAEFAKVSPLRGINYRHGRSPSRDQRLREELLELQVWWSRAPMELRQIVKLLLVGYFQASPPPLDVLEDTVLNLLQYDPENDYPVSDRVLAKEYLSETTSPADRQRLAEILEQEEAARRALRDRLLNP